MHIFFKSSFVILVVTFLALAMFSLNHKKEVKEVDLVIKNHYFEPAELVIPPNTKIKLVISNLDDTVEEFESLDLKRERIVPGKGKIKVAVGPLPAGRYKFFGEFHEKTAQGTLVVK